RCTVSFHFFFVLLRIDLPGLLVPFFPPVDSSSAINKSFDLLRSIVVVITDDRACSAWNRGGDVGTFFSIGCRDGSSRSSPEARIDLGSRPCSLRPLPAQRTGASGRIGLTGAGGPR